MPAVVERACGSAWIVCCHATEWVRGEPSVADHSYVAYTFFISETEMHKAL